MVHFNAGHLELKEYSHPSSKDRGRERLEMYKKVFRKSGNFT